MSGAERGLSITPSDSRGSYWSITINNPTADDNQQWSSLGNLPWVKKCDGQLEQGENGTPHIQGYVVTAHGRFLQKLRAALPRAHVEIARKPQALVAYCNKEETRIGKIEAIKTAGPGDVQHELYQELLYSGNRYFQTWKISQDDFLENLERHDRAIRDHWETLFDAAISRLIRSGFYGVEFAAANQQIRSAFKKYLPDILYRCHSVALTAAARAAASPAVPERFADLD